MLLNDFHNLFFFFFFSSRRRHTRSLCDWSSDVCSSDLNRSECRVFSGRKERWQQASVPDTRIGCRENSVERSEERRVGKSVDLGGRRIIKKKKNKKR